MRAECNFGSVLCPEYKPPTKKKLSNRGRKKKLVVKKPRKVQGTGKCFNSQITFLVQTLNNNMFNIKVFRPGEFEIHGIPNGNIDEGYEAIETLRIYLATLFNSDVEMMEFNVIMKNYKFLVLPSDSGIDDTKFENEYKKWENFHMSKYIIKLGELYSLLMDMKKTQDSATEKNTKNIQISDVSYSSEKTRLLLRFSTPSISTPKKKTLIAIYMSGKINILGGKEDEDIEKIRIFMKLLFENNEYIMSSLNYDSSCED
jgi:hypothetical protein